jgi:hypothetical protein
MPHASLKLQPGVDQTKTPALNEAAISVSQLVRFFPDRTLGGLVQKLGGWAKYIPTQAGSIVRNLWAWEDTNANSYLAIGAEGKAPIVVTGASGNGTTVTLTYTGPFTFVTGLHIVVSGMNPSAYNGTYAITSSTNTSVSFASATTSAFVSGGTITGGGGSLLVATNGGVNDITPQTLTGNAAVSFTTVSGSNAVKITLASSNAQNVDAFDIQTQVSVGGIVLFGLYQCYANIANDFYIYAYDLTGAPANATTAVTGGAVPSYTTASGFSTITVTLNDHGYAIGETFPALVATTVGGITVYGNYTVLSVPTANTFTIQGSILATSTATASENGGQLHYVFYRGIGSTYGAGGYGAAGYGAGGYGTGTNAPNATITGTPINATDWCLDNWGQILIANPLNGPIYQWDPSSGDTIANVIAEAPPVNAGCFVAMPQRQIVAWGSTETGVGDPLLIRWCDVNNYNDWTATLTNQAGNYRIPKGSRIVQGIQGPQQGLIWTDLGLWAMQYAGPPYVYQFNELGNGCGLIGRRAAGSVNGVVYWMGQSQFYRLGGNGVEPIACPVWDVAFQDLDTTQLDKIRVAPNSRFGEISWYYPTSGNNGEVSHYVKYNFVLNQWDYGTLGRTAWINESVLGPPIGADPVSTYIYQHEVSPDADGQPMDSYFQTGYFVITEANEKMFIDQVWPDMKWGYYGGTQSANVLLTFYVTDYPGQTPITYGPFSLTQATTYITPRFRGRLVAIKIESSDIGSWWRLGNIRYRMQPDGKY